MKNILTFIILFLPLFAFSTRFTVTTNADSGTGTLRQAIIDAAANGNGGKDSIIFQIADTSRASRTITIKSQLPALTSNLVLDGASQPGAAFGKTDARIIIQNSSVVAQIKMLHFEDANNVEVYGMFLYNTYWSLTFPEPDIRGVDFLRCHNIIIGKPGKGNYFRGIISPIKSTSYSNADTSRNVTIQSNVIGLNESGGIQHSYSYLEVLFSPYFAITLRNVFNIKIGGALVAEGNSILAANNLIESSYAENNGFIDIVNNRFNLTTEGELDLGGSSGNPNLTRIHGFPSDYVVTYLNNNHYGSLTLMGLTKPFRLQGNRIFTPSFFSTYDDHRLSILWCNGGLVGGELESEKNYIYTDNPFQGYHFVSSPDRNSAIDLVGSPFVTIKKNSIYCSAYYGSGIHDYSRTSYVRIDSTSVNFVKGKATPNSRIEVFLDDDCLACEGQTFLGTTTSSNDSTWSFTGLFNKVVVATATDSAGSTSPFSAPEAEYYSVKNTPSSCGLNNGSLVGMEAKGYERVEWKHLYYTGSSWGDTVVANTLDIYNLAPGRYYFHGWLGETCRGYPMLYIVDSVPLPRIYTDNHTLTHPSCGQFNGSITGVQLNGNSQVKAYWKNEFGQTIPAVILYNHSVSLENAAPGNYKLIVQDTVSGCTDSTQYFKLINQSGPTLSPANIFIKHAKCSDANGSITNISIQNSSANQYFKWEDSTGAGVAFTLDLLNVKAGKYRLKFKDDYACDTITTPFYTINNTGVIAIDTIDHVVRASACNLPTGAISNVRVAGAQTYSWNNVLSNQLVSSTLILSGVPSGNYRLTASNSVGCVQTSGIMFVPQSVLSPVHVTSVDSSHAYCDLQNAYIRPAFSIDTAALSFKWFNAATNNIVSNYSRAHQLSPGTYYLVATDTNQCFGEIYRTQLRQLGKPSFNETSLAVVHDSCDLGVGSITGLQVGGGGGSYTWSWTKDNTSFSTAANNIAGLTKATYIATVKDKYGCEVTSNAISVNNNNVVLTQPLANNQFILRNTQAHINILNYRPGTYSLFPDLNSTIPVASSTTSSIITTPVVADRLYYLQYQKGTCMSPLTAIEVKVFDRSVVQLPNAFSPNGDGINDVWKPTIQGIIVLAEWKVFNRYGTMVFSSTDAVKGWDGKHNGRNMPVGTYYWIVSAMDNENKPVNSSGSVTIVR